MKKFEFFEHTADIGVKIYGETLENLFENSADALLSLLITHKPKSETEERIVLEAETSEELLITWLNELIFLFFTYKFLPSDFLITIEDCKDYKMFTARMKGEIFDSCKNKINTEVKAATYHDLRIEQTPEGYVAKVIFDV